MSVKEKFQRCQFIAVLLIVFLIAACVPVASPEPRKAPGSVIGPFTPTPEIFSPVNPSPTSSGSALPMTCQVTDLNVYVNEEWGYCFAYPAEYTLDEGQKAEGTILLYGPALDENPDPIRISLEVTAQPVPAEDDLVRLVDAYLAQFQDVPMTITRVPWLLGSVPAEKLEPVPGLLSSRVVMALHDRLLLTLRFHPSDIDYAKQSLDDLTQTVTGSFAFLDGND